MIARGRAMSERASVSPLAMRLRGWDSCSAWVVRPGGVSHEDFSMTESTVNEQTSQFWYPRPVFFVSDVQRALRFYIDQLGFWKKWHEGDGKGTVCQVNRSDCEIILCQDAKRQDRGRLFVELNRDGLDELRREIAERSVPFENTWWGYDVIKIADPDGNELLFPIEGV